MPQAAFRFYAELRDFLRPDHRSGRVTYIFERAPSVKHAIEALGVPHTEVDLILVNGEPAGFSRLIEEGDRVSVYPVFESIDIGQVTRVRPKPLRELRFVLDCHLGRLAKYLRIMGFDTLYANRSDDEELAGTSSREKRVLLTMDRGLLKRSMVERLPGARSAAPAAVDRGPAAVRPVRPGPALRALPALQRPPGARGERRRPGDDPSAHAGAVRPVPMVRRLPQALLEGVALRPHVAAGGGSPPGSDPAREVNAVGIAARVLRKPAAEQRKTPMQADGGQEVGASSDCHPVPQRVQVLSQGPRVGGTGILLQPPRAPRQQ